MLPSFFIMTQVALETLRVSVPTILEAAAGRVSARTCDERLDAWSRRLLEQANVRLNVTGREHLQADESYVVMSNHQSHYDIPVLFQALQISMRMVAKKELFGIPFMAGAMRAAGFVELDRQKQRKSIEALSSARERLHRATSIWIAPEGTRSRCGRLGSFKRGGFYMAQKNGIRILPVTINGTQQILPAGSLKVRRGQKATVTISHPIDPANYGQDGINRLVAVVRQEIERHMMTPSITVTASAKSTEAREWAQ